MFALYLLYQGGDKRFPIRKVELHEAHYKCRLHDELNLDGLAFHELGIELSGKPDLIVRHGGKERYIENKPWNPESSDGQIQRYLEEARKSCAEFYILISCGNPQDELWQELVKKQVFVLLWEEVLLRMEDAKFFVQLAPGGSLKPYYETFLRRPEVC